MEEVKNGKMTVKIHKVGKNPKTRFLTVGARLAFARLRQAIGTILILHYFNLKCHIQIETDISRYTMSRIFCQLILDIIGRGISRFSSAKK